MKTTRTYEALIQFVNVEYEKLQDSVAETLKKVREAAGPEDEFDAVLGLANRLQYYGLSIASKLHNQSLVNSRVHEPARAELLFPPN